MFQDTSDIDIRDYKTFRNENVTQQKHCNFQAFLYSQDGKTFEKSSFQF